jgi:hypothetical protein
VRQQRLTCRFFRFIFIFIGRSTISILRFMAKTASFLSASRQLESTGALLDRMSLWGCLLHSANSLMSTASTI